MYIYKILNCKFSCVCVWFVVVYFSLWEESSWVFLMWKLVNANWWGGAIRGYFGRRGQSMKGGVYQEGAAPIKTNNSRQVFAADDVVALPPINVFLLEVDRSNRRCLHEDHQPTQVEIPYRSVIHTCAVVLCVLCVITYEKYFFLFSN